MSLFKINLTPLIKERDYEIKYIRSGRTTKTCSMCNQEIKVKDAATTFLKRVTKGPNTEYKSIYTCGNKNTACTINQARILNVELP
jgi:hypothetical protein